MLPSGLDPDEEKAVFLVTRNLVVGVAFAAGGKLEPEEVAVFLPWGRDLCDLHLHLVVRQLLKDCLVLTRAQPKPLMVPDLILCFEAKCYEGWMNHRDLLV